MGAVVEVEVWLCERHVPLCYCVPSVFCRKRPSGDFAKPSPEKATLGAGLGLLSRSLKRALKRFVVQALKRFFRDQIEHLS